MQCSRSCIARIGWRMSHRGDNVALGRARFCGVAENASDYRGDAMKWNAETGTLELTARNVAALTAKLDDPLSARQLVSPGGGAMVHAVDTANPDTAASAAAEGVITLTRAQLAELATEGAAVTVADITVRSVPDAAHYSDRPSGVVYMPTSGELQGPDTTHWKNR